MDGVANYKICFIHSGSYKLLTTRLRCCATYNKERGTSLLTARLSIPHIVARITVSSLGQLLLRKLRHRLQHRDDLKTDTQPPCCHSKHKLRSWVCEHACANEPRGFQVAEIRWKGWDGSVVSEIHQHAVGSEVHGDYDEIGASLRECLLCA